MFLVSMGAGSGQLGLGTGFAMGLLVFFAGALAFFLVGAGGAVVEGAFTTSGAEPHDAEMAAIAMLKSVKNSVGFIGE